MEVHFNIDFFLTIFLHSFSNSKHERLISAWRMPLDLNAAELKAEVVFALQRAIPRLCKFVGNSLDMVLLG